MKNLKQLSKDQLKDISGGLFSLPLELNCHCYGTATKPAIDTIANDAQHCFSICDAYRAG